MARIEKTIFISYRRTNSPWALAIYQDLTLHGYDVFFDYNGIASGDFERAIIGNITSRAHFVVLLTPSALERCDDPQDWLRREIETALNSKRNIVPLMLEGFDFGTPAIASQLIGRLALLRNYNALSIPPEYFLEAMGRLRDRYLNVPLEAVLHPVSQSARRAATEQRAAAKTAPAVQEEELTAQQWFERGFNALDRDETLRFYDQAIRLKPDYSAAFYNRALVRQTKGDLAAALRDYNKAYRLTPADVAVVYNRALVRQGTGDLAGALKDFNKVVRLTPEDPDAFWSRGLVRQTQGDLDGALQDYSEAIRLKPDDFEAFYNRGLVRQTKGDLDGALEDYDAAIRINPGDADAFYNRALVRRAKGDLAGAKRDDEKAAALSDKRSHLTK